MELLMHLAQVRIGDVGVDLGRINRGVAKELLHAADISAVAEKVGGERVAQRVRRHSISNTRLRDVLL